MIKFSNTPLSLLPPPPAPCLSASPSLVGFLREGAFFPYLRVRSDDYVDSSPSSRPAPERLYNTEVGYERSWTKARLNANFYHMLYHDQLVLTGQLNDVGAYTRTNVPESYRFPCKTLK